jgi:hypothetical protein
MMAEFVGPSPSFDRHSNVNWPMTWQGGPINIIIVMSAAADAVDGRAPEQRLDGVEERKIDE